MSWSLECWGRGWTLRNCREITIPEIPFRKITLVPYTRHAIHLKLAPSVKGVPVGVATVESEPTKDFQFFNKTIINESREAEQTYSDFPLIEKDQSVGRQLLTEFTENENIVLDNINPYQVYRITISPHKFGNSSTLFFRIYDNATSSSSHPNMRIVDENIVVRAEEISIVVLILALWMIAIALFVHRWGKIRMLEPYQPDYKAIHTTSCSLTQSVSPTHSQHQANLLSHPRPPSFKTLPRKSSSLCFTPSMLRTVHIPSTYRMSIPRIDFQTQSSFKGYPPHSRHALHRLRGRISSDSSSQRFTPSSDLCRKARSAENLRPSRMNSTLGRSIDEADDMSKYHSRKMSTSLENCKSTRHISSGGGAIRGASLDSAPPNKAQSNTPWWNQGMGSSCPYPDGRTTPEIRISPSPPEPVHQHPISYTHPRSRDSGALNHSHSCPHSRPPGLQRQEPLDDSFYPLPYATLHEEENEGEEMSQKPTLSRSKKSSVESQDSSISQFSRSSKRSQNSYDEFRNSVTQDTKV